MLFLWKTVIQFSRSSLLFNNSNRQMLFEVFFGCHNFIKHSIMEFIFGLKLAKKKYDVFSYNSSSSSWILILIPVFSQQQHDSFHWLCLCLFVLSNFIWKLWKNFVFRFLFIKFRNKNLLLRYGFGDPKCWYPFLDTFDSVKCNIYLCLKECFANEQFFSVFFLVDEKVNDHGSRVWWRIWISVSINVCNTHSIIFWKQKRMFDC